MSIRREQIDHGRLARCDPSRANALIGFEVANAMILMRIRAAPRRARRSLVEAVSLLDALWISLETVPLHGAIVLAELSTCQTLSLFDRKLTFG